MIVIKSRNVTTKLKFASNNIEQKNVNLIKIILFPVVLLHEQKTPRQGMEDPA